MAEQDDGGLWSINNLFKATQIASALYPLWHKVTNIGPSPADVLGGLTQPGYSPEQERLFGAQADIAKLYANQLQRRADLTGPYETDEGTLAGPMVDALNMIMGRAHDVTGRTRQRIQARPFNPFGDLRDVQTFGYSRDPMAGKFSPYTFQAGDGTDTGDDKTGTGADGESTILGFPPGYGGYGEPKVGVGAGGAIAPDTSIPRTELKFGEPPSLREVELSEFPEFDLPGLSDIELRDYPPGVQVPDFNIPRSELKFPNFNINRPEFKLPNVNIDRTEVPFKLPNFDIDRIENIFDFPNFNIDRPELSFNPPPSLRGIEIGDFPENIFDWIDPGAWNTGLLDFGRFPGSPDIGALKQIPGWRPSIGNLDPDFDFDPSFGWPRPPGGFGWMGDPSMPDLPDLGAIKGSLGSLLDTLGVADDKIAGILNTDLSGIASSIADSFGEGTERVLFEVENWLRDKHPEVFATDPGSKELGIQRITDPNTGEVIDSGVFTDKDRKDYYDAIGFSDDPAIQGTVGADELSQEEIVDAVQERSNTLDLSHGGRGFVELADFDLSFLEKFMGLDGIAEIEGIIGIGPEPRKAWNQIGTNKRVAALQLYDAAGGIFGTLNETLEGINTQVDSGDISEAEGERQARKASKEAKNLYRKEAERLGVGDNRGRMIPQLDELYPIYAVKGEEGMREVFDWLEDIGIGTEWGFTSEGSFIPSIPVDEDAVQAGQMPNQAELWGELAAAYIDGGTEGMDAWWSTHLRGLGWWEEGSGGPVKVNSRNIEGYEVDPETQQRMREQRRSRNRRAPIGTPRVFDTGPSGKYTTDDIVMNPYENADGFNVNPFA